MKLLYNPILIFALFLGLMSIHSDVKAQTKQMKAIELTFNNRDIQLGQVKKGDKISFSYEFTNTGKEDVAIDFVSGCDCTELDWPVKTYKTGESGKIDVVFLSAKKEESETVEIDVLLKNVDPKTKNPILEILTYTFKF
jgi:peptidoglycan-associated lipoprotein